jgi:hypothetical protein
MYHQIRTDIVPVAEVVTQDKEDQLKIWKIWKSDDNYFVQFTHLGDQVLKVIGQAHKGPTDYYHLQTSAGLFLTADDEKEAAQLLLIEYLWPTC